MLEFGKQLLSEIFQLRALPIPWQSFCKFNSWAGLNLKLYYILVYEKVQKTEQK